MNISFYLGDFSRSGGTERTCVAVANALSVFPDYNISLIVTNCISDTSFFEINEQVNIEYLSVGTSKWSYLHAFYKIFKSANRTKADVLVAVEVFSLLFILPALIFFSFKLKKTQPKLLVWEHFNFTVDLGKKMRPFFRKLAARYANAIVVLTKRDVDLWNNNLNVKGVIQAINNSSPFPVYKNEYNSNSKTIVAIGRLTYQKGFDRLIDLWSLYKNDLAEGWKLKIIGEGVDREILNKMILGYNLQNEIELVGNTSKIDEYYKSASFLIMTSRFEGLPMTLIEAQSYGLPILAYDCITGPSEVVTNDSGFLITENDKDDFLKKLNILISNVELREKMSKYAKIEAKRFSTDLIAEQWIKLLDKL